MEWPHSEDAACARRAGPAERGEHRACLWACLLLLALGAGANVWYLVDNCPLDLSGDEAYYWEWARRLDVSYADTNGPLTAYIIAGSRALLADWSRRVVGSEALAVRLPAVLLSTLTGLGIYVLALNVLRRPRVALAAVALTFTIPVLVLGSVVMTIDVPLACAWTWALASVQRALARDSRAGWLLTGLLIAAGILAKYNMVLLFPVVGLLILGVPELRRFLRRPGPYVATVLGLAGLVPILAWNSQHDWVSFRQVARQAGGAAGYGVDWLGPLAYVGAQAAIVGIVWFIAMAWAIVALWRRPAAQAGERHEAWAIKLLLLATTLPWLIFMGFSLVTKVQPNWPVLALIGGTILLAAWLARDWHTPARRRRVRALVVTGAVLGGMTVVVMHRMEWLTPAFAWLARGSPPLHLTPAAPPWELTPATKYDPSVRLRGWAMLGAAVGQVLEEQRAAGRDPFVLANDYGTASELAFYCPGQPTVYSAQSVLVGRRSQYDFWPNPIRDRAAFIGRPCLYVGSLHEALTGEGGGHAALPGLRPVRTVEYKVNGTPLQIWTIFACDAFAGFDGSCARP